MASKIRIDYKKLKVLARRHDLTLADLAKNMGWSRSSIYKVAGSTDPKVNAVNEIAEYFGLDISDLLTDDASRWRKENV